LSQRKPSRLFQASILKVVHPEIRKLKQASLSGFRFAHSIGTGRIDRRKLDISSPQISSYVFRVAASADGVKSVLRRLRPQEAALLDEIDSDIEQLQAQLDALRERRKETLHTAWQRGNVVRLKEVEDLLHASNT
jgi:hypothetical protein